MAAASARKLHVGILMTNRPEFIASLFGIALAGGVPVALRSTFSTPNELDYMLKASQISLLLFEQHVLKKDFHAMIAGLEPAIAQGEPATASDRFPFLRHLVSVGGVPGRRQSAGAPRRAERWSGGTVSLRRGAGIGDTQLFARAVRWCPAILAASSFHPEPPACPRASSIRSAPSPSSGGAGRALSRCASRCRGWTGNGFFWSGNISMVAGSAFSTGGAVILQRYFDETEALELIEKERIAFINGRPHQWARFQAAPNWASADLSSLKYIPRGEMIWEHPTVNTDWRVPFAFGTTDDDGVHRLCCGYAARGLPRQRRSAASRQCDEDRRSDVGRDPAARPEGRDVHQGADADQGYLGKAPRSASTPRGTRILHRRRRPSRCAGALLLGWTADRHDQDRRRQCLFTPVEVDDVIVSSLASSTARRWACPTICWARWWSHALCRSREPSFRQRRSLPS
ncbi:MAG: AMP-binding protein [Candidatus Nanopelagicales bacterium]